MSRIKYQHYVPRFYLEGFADPQEQLWVYDKKLDKAYSGNPKKIGGERFFYDVPKLEQELSFDQFVEKFFHPYETAPQSS